MKYKIVVDSASDLKKDYLDKKNIGFEVVPLIIQVENKVFVDNESLNINEMLDSMNSYSGKSTSSCPAPGQFLEAYKGASYVFVTTITGTLSGTYNSAVLASNIAKEDGISVHCIDSRGTCGSEILIVDKLVELIESNLSYEEICIEIDKYRDSVNLLFILHKFDNLVKNGRMSKLASFVANVFAIKPICQAENGEIKILEKLRGITNTFKRMVNIIGEKVKETTDKVCIISHCFASEDALHIKQMIKDKYNFKEIRIVAMAGLASFYSLEKGIIVCF